ncbi:hypothetical protein PDG61_10130 [Mycolicibacterium sp. BiH015]|uniref:hypothetical protein n=1 Tax=Mycolicibacterium sp. BiH015 TaxID=3018808 RepID=UPI0022E96759|nr:hypothetical protein [Mycolicibacterium sp. BiH015]MDA2891266.1 hypothetical protein [Mycolicibacterium sp. BiH015]
MAALSCGAFPCCVCAAGLAGFFHAVAAWLAVVTRLSAAQRVAPNSFAYVPREPAGLLVGLRRIAAVRTVKVKQRRAHKPQDVVAGGGDAHGCDKIWRAGFTKARGAPRVDDAANVANAAAHRVVSERRHSARLERAAPAARVAQGIMRATPLVCRQNCSGSAPQFPQGRSIAPSA